jgi:alpha-beta hydrolase superfamily lysophospholipase
LATVQQTEDQSMTDLDSCLPGERSPAVPDWRPDILGAGYSQLVLDLGTDPDGEGTVEAVLVRREPRPGEPEAGTVLYVHGFTDYFFQTDLADFLAARGLRFYALDLRKCGRARKPGQTAHYVSDLALYDAELDRALEIITAAHPGQPVILAAHSTGGLIVPLWLQRRRTAATPAGDITGVVLNSPWLDLQGSKTLRGPVTQLLRGLSKERPFQAISLRPGVYGQTLHVSATGEWDYDLALKPLAGFPVTFGWLNAVRRAHARLHHGIETGVPTLVLRSTQSHFSARYTDACDRADLILDTTQIARWAPSLGRQVTDAPIKDARHDVFLSIPESRASAYETLGQWLAAHHLGAAEA